MVKIGARRRGETGLAVAAGVGTLVAVVAGVGTQGGKDHTMQGSTNPSRECGTINGQNGFIRGR